MRPTQQLHDLGRSIWLDNITFADHGEIRELLPADGGDAEATLARFAAAGVDLDALAAQLQREGADAFVQSWNDLLDRITAKSDQLAAAR